MSGGRFRTPSAALLTGGASRRMGQDKSHLPVAGEALATVLARGLAGLFEDVMLVGGSPPADAPGRRVPDPDGPRCALRGLVAALDAARSPRVLVVATDMPGLGAELVLGLVAWPEADVVMPRSARGPEPLCAIYRREPCLERARACLEAGRLALHQMREGLEVSELAGADLARLDPHDLALGNVNTPEELDAWQRAAQASAAAGLGSRW